MKNSKIYKFSIRLGGIDAPEMRGKTFGEKEIACKAQAALNEKLLGKDVFLKNIEIEKYGRILCDVYLKQENISNWMISRRLAVPYSGGAKQPPSSWTEYHANNSL